MEENINKFKGQDKGPEGSGTSGANEQTQQSLAETLDIQSLVGEKIQGEFQPAGKVIKRVEVDQPIQLLGRNVVPVVTNGYAGGDEYYLVDERGNYIEPSEFRLPGKDIMIYYVGQIWANENIKDKELELGGRVIIGIDTEHGPMIVYKDNLEPPEIEGGVVIQGIYPLILGGEVALVDTNRGGMYIDTKTVTITKIPGTNKVIGRAQKQGLGLVEIYAMTGEKQTLDEKTLASVKVKGTNAVIEGFVMVIGGILSKKCYKVKTSEGDMILDENREPVKVAGTDAIITNIPYSYFIIDPEFWDGKALEVYTTQGPMIINSETRQPLRISTGEIVQGMESLGDGIMMVSANDRGVKVDVNEDNPLHTRFVM